MASNQLPIKRLTLYKHGVGFVEREGTLTESEVQLVFRQDEVNDALKSLLVIDRAGGQVNGIHYETPTSIQTQSKIQLSDDHSLLDLLKALRGRLVKLRVGDSATTTEEFSGQLVGVEVDNDKPLSRSLLTLLDGKPAADDKSRVLSIPISRLQAFDLLEDRAGQDLRFFLDSSRNDEAHRTVTLQLGEQENHDLYVSYLVPSPTWRVSYRLVAEGEKESGVAGQEASPRKGNLLLQGWGLFDNRLEEDLENVHVRLVAGQPISFIYDLATSHIPFRPTVKDEARVAAGPIQFDALASMRDEDTMQEMAFDAMASPKRARAMAAPASMMAAAAPPVPQPPSLQEVAQQSSAAQGTALGELFQYDVTTPVTVKRGESALVPILSQQLPYKHELLYNGAKLPQHPVSALKFKNATGLVLERGPVTIIEDGEYRGEALVPFTPDGSEVYLAYAVELGIKITESRNYNTETVGLRIEGAYFYLNKATITTTTYQFESNLDSARLVTIEHALLAPTNTLVETRPPDEVTGGFQRWNVDCPGRKIITFVVKERALNWYNEQVLNQNYNQLRKYFEKNWLDRATLDKLEGLLREQSAIAMRQKELNELQNERNQLYKRQEQLRQNLSALSPQGMEAELRQRVFNQLSQSEERLAWLDERENQLKQENKLGQERIDAELAGLKG